MYNKQGAQAYSHIMLQAAKKYALQVLFPCRPFPKGLMPRQASLSAHGPLHARPYRHPGHPQDKRGGPSIAPEPHSPRRSVPAAGPLSAPRPSRAPSAPRTAPLPLGRPGAALTSPLAAGLPAPPPAGHVPTTRAPIGPPLPEPLSHWRNEAPPSRRARLLPGPDMAAAGGARGRTSFQRRPGAGPRPSALPGTRPSLRHGQLLLSSGLPSLDCVLGWWERDWDPVPCLRRPPLCRALPAFRLPSPRGCSRRLFPPPRSPWGWGRAGRGGGQDAVPSPSAEQLRELMVPAPFTPSRECSGWESRECCPEAGQLAFPGGAAVGMCGEPQRVFFASLAASLKCPA